MVKHQVLLNEKGEENPTVMSTKTTGQNPVKSGVSVARNLPQENFFCSACLEDKKLTEQNSDSSYCRFCHAMLKAEQKTVPHDSLHWEGEVCFHDGLAWSTELVPIETTQDGRKRWDAKPICLGREAVQVLKLTRCHVSKSGIRYPMFNVAEASRVCEWIHESYLTARPTHLDKPQEILTWGDNDHTLSSGQVTLWTRGEFGEGE